MKSRHSTLMMFLLVILVLPLAGQIENFEYRTKIENATEGWNAIDLPNSVFSKSANNLEDIRIYHHNDTSGEYLEQAYKLDIQSSKKSNEWVSSKIINTTSKGNIYSYTFQLSNTQSLNHIQLDFTNRNFDWKIHLKGSMTLNNWETILDDYRVVSITRPNDSFRLTDLNFSESKFNYYKITFQADQKPVLKNVLISNETYTTPNYRSCNIGSITQSENAKRKTTIIEIDLAASSPVGKASFDILDGSDYYRPLKIEGAIDSFETEKGWKYRYSTLYKGSLYSLRDNVFTFADKLVKKVKITIYNDDNQPLEVGPIRLSGPNYRVISRLEETENVYLVFGDSESKKPKYDLTYFENKIPEQLHVAEIGAIQYFPKSNKTKSPLFANKWWLWVVMAVVILLLGAFTIKMVQEGS